MLPFLFVLVGGSIVSTVIVGSVARLIFVITSIIVTSFLIRSRVKISFVGNPIEVGISLIRGSVKVSISFIRVFARGCSRIQVCVITE